MDRIGSLLLGALLLMTSGAHGATMAEEARALGIIGKWASGGADCGQPASKDNSFYIWFVSGSDVFLRREFGVTTDQNKVLRLEPVGDVVEIDVNFGASSATRTMGYKILSDQAMHIKYNHDSHGGYTIKDFHFTATGKPTVPARKCG
ncbi:MAG: hypothetical protein WAK01_19670 [Methylocystis sp.]|jgi:hypothetical protein